jgi:hypothetical protein
VLLTRIEEEEALTSTTLSHVNYAPAQTTAALFGVANPSRGVVREILSLVWWFRAKAQ